MSIRDTALAAIYAVDYDIGKSVDPGSPSYEGDDSLIDDVVDVLLSPPKSVRHGCYAIGSWSGDRLLSISLSFTRHPTSGLKCMRLEMAAFMSEESYECAEEGLLEALSVRSRSEPLFARNWEAMVSKAEFVDPKILEALGLERRPV